MRVWLLTVGEPLPTDGASERAWRTGLLARQLMSRGHEVVWWSSAFDHFRHRRRERVDQPIAAAGLTVWHLSGADYQRNISLSRLLNHNQVARRFRQLAPAQPKPDVIVSSLPTIELCCAAVDFGIARDVPVVIDVRDLWPDVLTDLVPHGFQWLARLGLQWMRSQLRHATRGATAILGLTDEFVDWGLEASGRQRSLWDRTFPMGYTALAPTPEEQDRARRFWQSHGLKENSERSIVCFFGTLGWMFDFETVLTAAAQLRTHQPEIQFVLCGDGERRAALQRSADGLDNVLMPGRIGHAEIWELMRRSMAGLAPYRPFRNFDDNLANKPIEYLSAGLPVIATNVRVLKRLLDDAVCGLTYSQGDAAALSTAILALHDDHVLRASLSKNASAVYHDRFVAERVYTEMAVHLEDLAASGDASVRRR